MIIERLMAERRFRDCKHRLDAGKIRAAVEAGHWSGGGYRGFLKLDEEIEKVAGRSARQMTVERIAAAGKTKLRNRPTGRNWR